MKLSTYAKKCGLKYQTVYKWIIRGTFPCRYERLPTGTIIVHEDDDKPIGAVAIYGRASSHEQKPDLERQMQRLRDFCAGKGMIISKEVSEVASGLNDHRKGLGGLLTSPDIGVIVVEHRDRLARFGTHTLELALKQSGRQIIVMNETEDKTDLIQDFIDVVTSMCARIYGKRSAKNRAKRMIEAGQ